MTAPTTLSLPTIRNHDPRARSPQRYVGPLLAAVGFGIVMVTAIANWVSIDSVGSDPAAVAETTLWAGGFGVLGLGVIKVAVAVVLVGIILRLWIRVDAMKQSLPAIRVRDGVAPVHSTDKRVEVSPDAPQPLLIHRVATRLWKPMLAMGAMTVILGAILRAVGAGQGGGTESFRQLAAWGIGIEFFGEALLLSGISFLLATILASLRHGGSEVQQALGADVKVLKMPTTAKAFMALMMLGMMAAMVQLVASIFGATIADDPARFTELGAFVGPLRELSLGLILAGIVLALATIGNVLRFQFDRVRELLRAN